MHTNGNFDSATINSIPRSTSKRDGLIFIDSFSVKSSPPSTPLFLSTSSSSSPASSISEISDHTLVQTVSNQSFRSSISGSIPSHSSLNARKLSRKLPPNLTESLECLANIHLVQPAVASIALQSSLFSPTYSLSVAAPFPAPALPTFASPPPITPKNPARKMSTISKASISAPTADVPPVAITAASPSSASEVDTLPPLTPRTSMPSLRAGPRHSLFVSSSLLGKQMHSSSSSSSLRSPRDSLNHFAPSEGVPALSCSSTSAGESSSCGTWSTFDAEHRAQHSGSSSTRSRESRKARKVRQAGEKARFDESTPPTTKELFEASLTDVIDEKGQRVRFGDLVRGRKTIVVFIRHWFCPLCAQYIKSVIRDVSPDALEEAGVELIIIGNGSAKMINGYANKYFNSPFKTYTDPSLNLYRLLGLTRQTMDAGSDSERGDYLTETALETTVSTLKRATKMPLRNPGHFTQLGGEFVFDGTLNVIYTHRMINTRAHAPIRDVCREAGVRLEFIHYEPGPAPPVVHMRSTEMLGHYPTEETGAAGEEVETDDWFVQKEKTLERIRTMRAERRNGGSIDQRAPSERGVRVVIPEEEEDGDVDEFGQLTRELYA